MAELLFKCSGCSAHLAVDTSGVGRLVNCTTCGQKVLVPEAGIAFNCPECPTKLTAPSGMAGEAFDCPGCNAGLTVPAVTPQSEADVLFACTGCSLHLSAQSDSVGQVINCTDCGQKVVVPKPSITFDCPMCQAKLAAPSSLAGQTFGCPSCDTDLVVPSVNSISEKQSTLLSVKNSSSPQTENVKLRLAKRCPKCGTILAQDASICDMCGAGIVVEPAPVHLNPDGSPLKKVPFARLATRGLGRAESDLEAIRSKRPPRRHAGQQNEMPSPSENGFPPGRACPYCGKSIALASIICIHCGTNLQTGRRHGTTNLTSKPQSPVEKLPGCIVKVCGTIIFAFFAILIIALISDKINNPDGEDESSVKSTPTTPTGSLSSILPKEAQGMDDDQLYGYVKVKQETADLPATRVALLKAYVNRFPQGRHVGEATALLDDARKRDFEWEEQQKVATLQVQCSITLNNGNVVPLQGWVQVIDNPSTVLRMAGESDDMVRMSDDEDLRRASMDSAVFPDNDCMKVKGFGLYYRKILNGGKVVAAGKIQNGMVVFENVPAPNNYWVYGGGMAGHYFVGIVGMAFARGGETLSVDLTQYPSRLDFTRGSPINEMDQAWAPLSKDETRE